jgi:hypothetical protein
VWARWLTSSGFPPSVGSVLALIRRRPDSSRIGDCAGIVIHRGCQRVARREPPGRASRAIHFDHQAIATRIFPNRDMVSKSRQTAARDHEDYRRRCRSRPTIASAAAPTSTGPPIVAPATIFANKLGRRPWYWPKEADPTIHSTNPRAARTRDVECASMPRRLAPASREPLRASMPAPLARSHARDQSLTDLGVVDHSEPIPACTWRPHSRRCGSLLLRGAR